MVFLSSSASRVVLLVVILSLAGVSPAAAQWTVMLAHTIANVQQAIGVWEKHQRIIEDQFMQLSGVLRPFSELDALYTDARSLIAGTRRPILAHMYQAGFLNPACFSLSGRNLLTCELSAAFEPTEFRTLRWNLHYVPAALPTGFEWSDWEQQVNGAWDVALDAMPPGRFGDAANSVPDILETRRRIKRAYYTSRWSARRMAAATDYGRRGARQVLHRPGAGSVSRLSQLLGCPGAEPQTLLELAYLADCATPSPPGGGAFEAEGPQHLSSLEKQQLQVQAAIVHTTLLAADLEKEIIEQENLLRSVTTVRDVARESQRRRLLTIQHGIGAGGAGCDTAADPDRCRAAVPVFRTSAQEAEAREFFGRDS